MLKLAKKELNKHADKNKADFLKRFFKTSRGQYASGDIFLGITVPVTRQIAKKFRDLPFPDVLVLLKSNFHEERLLALFILIDQYARADRLQRQRIFDAYLHLAANHVNNWDLVDASADKIAGKHLLDRSRQVLYKLARSQNLWEKRIAIISTFYFIKNQDFEDTLKIAEILMHDKHDLIHKAVGWMLREVGNRSLKHELRFLDKNASRMPRTMLRYAIEKFPEKLRKKYLGIKYQNLV